MSSTISPNMMLVIPTVGQEFGPQYAFDVNTSFTLVDIHDHSNGSGVQINPAGININSNLTFSGNFATNVAGITFGALGSAPANNTVYESGVDLYFVDGLGNNIQLTKNGSIAGATGSIAGLVSPASATYVPGSATFVWQSDVNTAANMDAGSIFIRNISPNSTNAIKLQAPAGLSSNYNIVLPALPGALSLLSLDASGNMGTSTLYAVLPIAQGGTNNGSLGVVAGGIYYGDGARLQETAAGIAGQTLQSNAASAPTWSDATACQYSTVSAASSTTQPINFATQVFDPDTLVTTGSSWHFTCPYAGVYTVSVTSSNDTGVVPLFVYKNGVSGVILCDSSAAARVCGTSLVSCAAGDLLDVRAGTPVNITSASISINRVR